MYTEKAIHHSELWGWFQEMIRPCVPRSRHQAPSHLLTQQVLAPAQALTGKYRGFGEVGQDRQHLVILPVPAGLMPVASKDTGVFSDHKGLGLKT
jgi:hypothetical protein